MHEEAHDDRKWWTLAAMCFALFMIMLDNTVVNVAMPSIQRELHASFESLEWVINSYVLSFAALILLGGKLGDRFGRKRIFLVGLAIFTLSSVWCALSTSDSQLIIARTLQGVGGALLNPLSLSILVSAFPRKQVPTAIGIWAGVSGLGLAVGPLLGGWLVEHQGWSSVFWINVPIGVIAAIVTVLVVKESSDSSTRTLDIVGTVLVTAGLFALIWGLIQTNTHGWLSINTLLPLGAAIALFLGFTAYEARIADPMIPLSFFRTRSFDTAALVVTLVGFALFGTIYFLTLYLQNVRGYSAIGAGARTLPMTLMVMIVAPVAGKLTGRFGPRPLMTIGMLSASVGLLILTQLTTTTNYWVGILPAFVLIGAGIALTMPTTTGVAMGSVDPRKSGIASGVINASRQVGGALGIAVLGSINATTSASRWSDYVASVPESARKTAASAADAVSSGQVAAITAKATETGGKAAGARAGAAAADAFVHGLTTAMYVGTGLTFAAALAAYFGLRHFRAGAHAPGAAPVVAVEI